MRDARAFVCQVDDGEVGAVEEGVNHLITRRRAHDLVRVSANRAQVESIAHPIDNVEDALAAIATEGHPHEDRRRLVLAFFLLVVRFFVILIVVVVKHGVRSPQHYLPLFWFGAGAVFTFGGGDFGGGFGLVLPVERGFGWLVLLIGRGMFSAIRGLLTHGLRDHLPVFPCDEVGRVWTAGAGPFGGGFGF